MIVRLFFMPFIVLKCLLKWLFCQIQSKSEHTQSSRKTKPATKSTQSKAHQSKKRPPKPNDEIEDLILMDILLDD